MMKRSSGGRERKEPGARRYKLAALPVMISIYPSIVECRAVEVMQARSNIKDFSGCSAGSSQYQKRLLSRAQFAHCEPKGLSRIRLIHLDALSKPPQRWAGFCQSFALGLPYSPIGLPHPATARKLSHCSRFQQSSAASSTSTSFLANSSSPPLAQTTLVSSTQADSQRTDRRVIQANNSSQAPLQAGRAGGLASLRCRGSSASERSL